MKYGKVYRTRMREGITDGMLTNVALTGALMGPKYLAPAAADTVASNVMLGNPDSPGIVTKTGRRIGLAIGNAKRQRLRNSCGIVGRSRLVEFGGGHDEVNKDKPYKFEDDKAMDPGKRRAAARERFAGTATERAQRKAVASISPTAAQGMRHETIGSRERSRLQDVAQKAEARSMGPHRTPGMDATWARRKEVLARALKPEDNQELGRKLLDKRAKQMTTVRAAAARPKGNTPIKTPGKGLGYGMGVAASLGAGGYMAGKGMLKLAQSVDEGVKAAAATNYRAGMSHIGMESLRENAQAWVTRRAKYGPSGRKHRTWKFDFNKPTHVKKALGLKSDSDIKKLMNSKANPTKHVGVVTKGGVPLKFAYRSNDGKQLYAGKTIGMRQKIISDHKKLGLPVPKGFENWGYADINNLFKKNQRHGWYKRSYSKAPITTKIAIQVGSLYRKAKKALGFGESAIVNEIGSFVESAAPVVVPTACAFMEGAVATPVDCDCADCLAVTRRIREQTKLSETAETSFGQNLRAGVVGAEPVRLNPKLVKKFGKKPKGAADGSAGLVNRPAGKAV